MADRDFVNNWYIVTYVFWHAFGSLKAKKFK